MGSTTPAAFGSSALAAHQSVMRFARRCGCIVADLVELLEHDERPRPQRRRQRVLGRAEIERLLEVCSARDRLRVATGVIHVRAQLSRAHRGAPSSPG